MSNSLDVEQLGATTYADGAIVGSAFIKQLAQDASAEGIERFVFGLRG